ncbi:hypothetical protein NM208_g6611 [Fusarium decemcellulare]|uniref:Uncharacterized protein n=1 Tax=Fusarium decemcellulare TaxID=57161 RepID=A0ACC1SCD0_9HYPO|nr:hypothetical protein NM208_g6611 [Fusarium decemcellulare]
MFARLETDAINQHSSAVVSEALLLQPVGPDLASECCAHDLSFPFVVACSLQPLSPWPENDSGAAIFGARLHSLGRDPLLLTWKRTGSAPAVLRTQAVLAYLASLGATAWHSLVPSTEHQHSLSPKLFTPRHRVKVQQPAYRQSRAFSPSPHPTPSTTSTLFSRSASALAVIPVLHLPNPRSTTLLKLHHRNHGQRRV